MNCNCITAEMIRAKKEEIFKLFRPASILSFSGNHDEEGVLVLQGPKTSSKGDTQHKELDRKLFDAMVEVLSLPATKAIYFVARLVGGKSLIRELGSSLHIAAANGQTSVVKVLLDRGANMDAPGDDRWTALHYAARLVHIDVVKVLLDRGATIDAVGGDVTALHHAAREGHIKVVNVLLDRGANIDATNDNRWTALHHAAMKGHMHIEVLKVLLDRGANVDTTYDNKQTGSRWTALHQASREGHVEAVKVLLDRGATIDDRTYTRLEYSSLFGEARDGYISAPKWYDSKSNNETALHHAAREGYVDTMVQEFGGYQFPSSNAHTFIPPSGEYHVGANSPLFYLSRRKHCTP